ISAPPVPRDGTSATHSDYLDNSQDVPVADSPEDVTERTVTLSQGIAHIERIADRVEVTVKLRGRLAAALILSEQEAEQIGMALARPGGWTVGDYWDIQDQLDGIATECACPDDRCAGYHHDADLDHCPCADALATDAGR
ncbi:MAG: hypothetical protein L0G94_15180, partial [Brachybacterium sp.]|uniref:hypothetical protein n=1 Tax=Brachybacterium sp. TaxID=1891286 RepID=UPI00264741FB